MKHRNKRRKTPKKKKRNFVPPKPNPNEPLRTGVIEMSNAFVTNNHDGTVTIHENGRQRTLNVTAEFLNNLRQQGVEVRESPVYNAGGDLTLNVEDDLGMIPQPIDFDQPETPVQNAAQPFHNIQLGVDGDMVPMPVI